MILKVILLIGLSFLLNLIFTPVIIKLSHRNSWFDHIDQRKIHDGQISRLGGIGIYVSFFLVMVVGVILYFPEVKNNILSYILLIAGLTTMNIVGTIDDFHTIRAVYKLGGQILAGILIISGGFSIQTIEFPFSSLSINLGYIGPILTLFWLVALSNAINLMDGLDGLAGGISLWAALGMGLLGIMTNSESVQLLSFPLVGSLLAFLVFNLPFPKAKIFMGDSGALTIGFIIATLPLLFTPGRTTTLNLFVPSSLLILPILDTFAAIIRRLRNKQPIHQPDRAHLHHKLLDLGFNNKQILLIVYLFSFVGILMTLSWSKFGHYVGILLIFGFWIVGILFFTIIHFANKRLQKESPN
ncbi:MraY family glycosyltransferase [Spirochaeta cellobiosiphila]|uniref:MraY family glycosyltransferase n=1 Tax=Spirochaeta cellobiosiphila TaxID=504483 RepID=UPI0004237CF7|nr:MraY family glycosyltransferase [Spirochaeta cellobiosiphila]